MGNWANASLDVEVPLVEDVVVVARDNTGHSIPTASRPIPVDLVFLILVHSVQVVSLPVAKLLFHGALICEGEPGEVCLHGRR